MMISSGPARPCKRAARFGVSPTANFGTDILYNNDANTGYFSTQGESWSIIDEGRIPGETEGNADCYEINCYQTAYCTNQGTLMTLTATWYDGYAKPDVSSPALLGEFNRVIRQYVARTGRSLDHMQNFLDCVRSRERTVANPEVMHHSMTTVHAANICMWLKRSLKFDPAKEEFVGDDEANSLRSRAMREPYVY